MKTEEQRIAIAIAMGARWYLFDSGYTWLSFKKLDASPIKLNSPFTNRKGDWSSVEDPVNADKIVLGNSIPDYLNDLNAMHEAEKTLDSATSWNGEEHHANAEEAYMGHLQDASGRMDDWRLITATAAQRAEAFLRTIGKWKGDS